MQTSPPPGAPRRRSSPLPVLSGAERVLLSPSINLLEHGLSNEVTDTVEMVVAVNDPHEVLVVAPLDPARDGDLREDLLPRLR